MIKLGFFVCYGIVGNNGHLFLLEACIMCLWSNFTLWWRIVNCQLPQIILSISNVMYWCHVSYGISVVELTLDILTSYNIGLRDAPFLLSKSYEKGAWYCAKYIFDLLQGISKRNNVLLWHHLSLYDWASLGEWSMLYAMVARLLCFTIFAVRWLHVLGV